MTTFTDDLLDELSTVGDPPADDVVAEHAAQRPDARPQDLVRDVARHLVLPAASRSPAISGYLAQTPPLPPWTDPALLQRSADFYDLAGLHIGAGLFCASLPEAYAGARGARVLTLTARMVTDPVRRVYETAQMIFDSMSRGGLTVGTGAGYQDIRRVRLMHAAVRHLILHDPDVVQSDDPDAPMPSWYRPGGMPLNQEDLLGTLMTFTTVVLDALERQGIGYEQADAAAYLHTWCVVAHLLGIRPDLLPIDLDQARLLTTLIRQRQQRPSPDGLVLGNALVGALEESVRVPVVRRLPATLIRWYCGDTVAAINGIHGSGWTAVLFDPAQRLFTLVRLAEQHNKMVRVLNRRLTVAILRSFLSAGRSGDRPAFTLPQELEQQVQKPQRRWRFW